MATMCTPTPTETRTDVATTQSFTTTASVSTSTLPGDVTISTFRTCVPTTVTNATTCVFQDETTIVTLPGNTTLVTVPVTVPIDITTTNLVTLFGSSCTTSPTNTPVTTPPDTTIPVPVTTPPVTSPPSNTFTPTDTTTTTPYIFTSTTSTTSDPPPATTGDSVATNTSHKKSNNAGPIAGGVIGGLAALLFLGFLTWKLIKKQRRFDFDDIFNDKTPSNTPHYKKRVPETKPYNYGVIGQPSAHPTGLTSPSSPPPTQPTFGNQQASTPYGQHAAPGHAGAGQGMGNGGSGPNNVAQGTGPNGLGQGAGNAGAGQGIGQGAPGASGQGVGQGGLGHTPALQPEHLRNPSLTPLLAGIAVAATAGAANAAAASASSSRPSTSSSSVGPQVYPANQQSQQSNPGDSAGSSSSSSMYPPALQSWAAARVGNVTGTSQEHGSGTAGPSSLAHNASAGSTSTMYTSASSLPPMVPVVVGSGARNNHSQPHQHQDQHRSSDPFMRSGSPVSVQEQRILQVTNADPSSPLYPPVGPSRQSYVGGSYFPNQTAGSSSSGVGSSPLHTSRAAAVDGKGRPLNSQGEKVPLVHLDGGLYQVPEPRTAPDAAPTEPAPPAYSS